MNKLIKAVIFDFDGVIINSEIYLAKIEDEYVRKYIAGWTSQNQQELVGKSTEDTYTFLVEKYGLSIGKEEYIKGYEEAVFSVYESKAELIDGVVDLINFLDTLKIKLAIASSSQYLWIETALKRFGLFDKFSFIATTPEFGVRGKPFPDIYLKAAEGIGVHPSNISAIEDSRNGVLSAKSAGMYCFGFKENYNNQDLSKADIVVDKMKDIKQKLGGK